MTRSFAGWFAVIVRLALIPAGASAAVPPAEIPLYAGTAPGSEGATQIETRQMFFGQPVVVNVTRPTLTAFLPAMDRATGAAVIVALGGGFKFLAVSEGADVARWLADHGVAAFVLKYRIDATPANPEGFKKAFMGLFRGRPGSRPVVPDHPLAVADAQTALELVRRRASEWRIDPKRVGIIGFSAGSMVALKEILDDKPGSLPDFAGLIYGPMDAAPIPSDAPPVFFAFAANDPLFGGRGFGIVDAWVKSKHPAELHMFERGGHGFGMRHMNTTSDHWIEEFYWWLEDRGVLRKSESP